MTPALMVSGTRAQRGAPRPRRTPIDQRDITMAVNDMNQLLKHELGDLLYAERTFLKGLKKMSKEISDPMMKERVIKHAAETEQQIEVLGKAFESIGLKPRAEKCDAAIGLKEEHDSFLEDEPSKEMLEAFDLGSGLRIEHYEIAGYRSAIAIAKEIGRASCRERV